MELRLNSASVEVEVEVEAELGKNRKYKRGIVWFNPTYSQAVRTYVGMLFLKLFPNQVV